MPNIDIKLVRGGPGGEHQIVTIKGVKIQAFYAAMLMAAHISNKGFPINQQQKDELLDGARDAMEQLMDNFD